MRAGKMVRANIVKVRLREAVNRHTQAVYGPYTSNSRAVHEQFKARTRATQGYTGRDGVRRQHAGKVLCGLNEYRQIRLH